MTRPLALYSAIPPGVAFLRIPEISFSLKTVYSNVHMFEEIHCRIEGRVQMVMFRDFAQRKARSLDIVGWVKNLKDGSVEIVGQGTPDQLKQYIEKLHEGSILSRVDSVSVDWRAPSGHFDDFIIVFI